jgi:beta-galactosidase
MRNRYIGATLCLVLITCANIVTAQSRATNVTVPANAGVQKIQLDGTWQFTAAKGTLAPTSSAPLPVDAKAKEIASDAQKGKWADVYVPQFLNRISWWLPDVSREYEQQEIERVSKLPAEATTTQAGWYTKTIILPKDAASKEVYANFEGVALVSRVYCNGALVGSHLGMFGSFKCRLTPYLKAGQNNQLLVYVERGVKSKEGDKVVSVEVSVPVTQNMLRSLNKSMFDKIGPKYNVMGIWLPVTLEISEAGGRIDDVFFNPSLNGHSISFTMENPDHDRTVFGKLSYTITNKKTGNILASQTVKPLLKIAPGDTTTFSITKTGLKPDLWTPDFPNLYVMDVRWTTPKGRLIHQWKEQVGYRTIAAKGEQVMLNGKPYWSRGANMAPYGYKPNDAATAKAFLKLMHDGNTVITRSHGNPWNNMWFTAADEIGIGVSCEAATWALLAKEIPPAGNIAAWKKEQLEIVKQYRNHPSILFYVVSNEGLPNEDAKNVEKLAIYKDIITSMRKIDSSRLIFQTSGNPDYNNIADIEDTHSYWDWYMSSSYVNDYTKPQFGLSLQDGRPFLSQEVAVPYSMIDDGSVHPSYIGRYCAQAWVGDLGVYGGNYDYFQEHIRAVSKLKAEKLRYSRAQLPSAGFMLFSNVTWIKNALSKPVADWKPFPVYYAVKDAYRPVLVGLTTTQHVFYAEEQVSTDLFVVNDNAQTRNFQNAEAQILIKNAGGQTISTSKVSVGKVDYYQVKKIPVTVNIPAVTNTSANTYNISVSLFEAGKQVALNKYPVRIIAPKTIISTTKKNKIVGVSGVAPQLVKFLQLAGVNVHDVKTMHEKVDIVLIGSSDAATTPEQLQRMLKPGGRAIVLGQGEKAQRFCEEVIKSFNEETGAIEDKTPNKENTIERVQGEFVEMLNYDSSKSLYQGLKRMDWKWWATGNNKPAIVTIASHKLKIEKDNVVALGRYLEPHAYWSGKLDEVYKQKIGYPVFAVNYPWGQLVVCDLIIEEAIDYDPRAGQTILNLMTADLKK